MADHITTFTGRHIVPTDPHAEEICIDDIAHALPMICRGNGHVRTFFSVGQHCLLCAKEALARGYGSRLALACLLHDASEAYMSDVPRPFKKYLNEYLVFEDRLLDVIYEKFLGSRLTEEEAKAVKTIDDAMLWYDLQGLFDEPMTTPKPEVLVQPDHTVRPFEDVETEYKRLFDSLYSQL